MRKALGLIVMLVCSAVVGGEPDFTMRDRSGNVVTWNISKPDCDVRDGMEQVMNKFGLTSLKLLPMCGEKISFFEDRGEYNGVEYKLVGAEYSGPWGTRCAYATAEGPEDIKCPRDVEVALHVMGKFRYCLWGGNWMCRRTYEQEIATGTVINGPAALAMQQKLMAAGMAEAAAWEQAAAACKKEASLWMAGSVVKDVPIAVKGMKLQLVSSKDSIFYATITERTETIKIQEPRIVQRSVMENQLAKSRECMTVQVDRNSLTEQALRDAGVIKDGEKLTKVLFRERETTTTDNNDVIQSAPLDVVMVDKVIEKTIATIRTFPVSE